MDGGFPASLPVGTGWVRVGTLDDVPRLGSRVVRTADEDIAVFRTADDRVFALYDRCPHRLRSMAVALTTKPAPSNAARRSVVCSMISPAPALAFSSLASSVILASVCALRPTSVSVLPRSSSLLKMSRSMLSPNDMLVAPMKTILVLLVIGVSRLFGRHVVALAAAE